jgi:hypothetical protein
MTSGAIAYQKVQYHSSLVCAIFSVCKLYYPPQPTYTLHALLIANYLPNFGISSNTPAE